MRCIDVHCYYGKWGFPIYDRTIADILEMMARAEVEKTILISARAIQYDFVAGNAELAEAIAPHPQLKIVMGHMGGSEWMAAIRAAEQASNLYLDTCASYADRDKIGTAVRMLGADRVLFGSGATEGSLAMQKNAVLDADITAEERIQVLYENARRLFNL